MPKRETYSSHLKCPKCNNQGTAVWSENENPVYGGGLDCQLESVSAGFEISSKPRSKEEPEIICTECKLKSSL